MKIKSLSIDNFRGIKHLSLNFADEKGNGRDLAILAGVNGCGKTSILEAILVLLGRKELLPSRIPQGKADIMAGSNDYEISAIFEFGGKEVNVVKTSGNGMPAEQLKAFNQEAEKIPVEYFSSWRMPKLVGSVSVTIGKKGKRPVDSMENRLWRLKQYLVDLTARKSFIKSDEDREFTEKSLQDALKKLNRIWYLMYPKRAETLAAEVAGADVSEGFDLFLSGRNRERIPADSLSSGEIELLTMLGRFIKDDFSDGIVLVDEPELHLHPSWHRIIVSALKEFLPNAQIIVATHSPLVLSDINADAITVLTLKDNTIKAEKPKYSYGLDVNRVLEEIMKTQERIPAVQNELAELFRLIGDKKLSDARVMLKTLQEKLPEEPELTRAGAILSRMEVLEK